MPSTFLLPSFPPVPLRIESRSKSKYIIMRTNLNNGDDSLWTLAGCVAIEAMGGPSIPWKAGRTDYEDASKVRFAFTSTQSQTESCCCTGNQQCAPNGRLPDASQASSHLRLVLAFQKMWHD